MTPKSKSKYNRHNNPQKKASPNETSIAGPARIDQKPNVQVASTFNTKSNQSSNTAAKANLDLLATSKSFISELKWITLVTGIIIILLISSYFIFR
jgi:hypothetical protein